jgi:protein-disulfide isomerase
MEEEIVKLTLPVNSSRDHIQGPSSASVTLLEYGDYQCPYFGQAYPIVRQVQKHLGSKLCFVFRNFPITQIHPHAQHAAEAAECAAAQNKFWEMHDHLYDNQQALDDNHLEKYANMQEKYANMGIFGLIILVAASIFASLLTFGPRSPGTSIHFSFHSILDG